PGPRKFPAHLVCGDFIELHEKIGGLSDEAAGRLWVIPHIERYPSRDSHGNEDAEHEIVTKRPRSNHQNDSATEHGETAERQTVRRAARDFEDQENHWEEQRRRLRQYAIAEGQSGAKGPRTAPTPPRFSRLQIGEDRERL